MSPPALNKSTIPPMSLTPSPSALSTLPAASAKGAPAPVQLNAPAIVESVAAPALSNRAIKAAASQLLNLGTLPKGFAALAKGNEKARAAIAEARKARAETFANLPEARRAALAQVTREAMGAAKFTFADSGKGAARLSYR